jgi:hypothetical protein
MSDVIVLIAIVWACLMTGIALHFHNAYHKSMQGGARLLQMLIGLGTGSAKIEKKSDGSVVFEDDEHKIVMTKGEQA